ncbi:PI-PLC X domain-containing protein 1 isoform X2 [Brachyhypopomus gauderio]|uniref:PI-PLC X domain-containing protein 1 isoform X2 n=1 Tax=Brachyhypopomus gauderio TaxID=698409 RepID=UPI0040415326
MVDVRKTLNSSSCSDWMSQLPAGLVDVPLWDLAIPGSHDSMTYCLDKHSHILHSQPKILRILDRIVPCFIRPCDLVVFRQLESGIRFLDLRIAHKPKDSDESFFFAHGIYTLVTVKEALSEVACWLEHHVKEVVIISLSAFDDMTPVQHSTLIDFLKRIFDKKLCPKSEIPTLKKCWTHGYQLVVSYADQAGSGHAELWPEFQYWWANESDPNLVISYLQRRKETEGRPDCFFIAGLNLTEDVRYILQHPGQSMRSMTLRAFSLLLGWVKQQRPGSEKTCLNIICADFVGISRDEFIRIVIGLNIQQEEGSPAANCLLHYKQSEIKHCVK